jgi:hypothetical protein
VAREQVAHRQHIAVEMHRALGLPRGATRERDQADVIGGRVARGERVGLARHRGFERIGTLAVEVAHAFERRTKVLAIGTPVRVQLVAQTCIAECSRHLRLVDDLLELLGAQQRHRRHGDQSCLERGKPARRHHQVVRAAQQHAIARHQPHVLDQHMRDAIHKRRQLGIGHGLDTARALMAHRHAATVAGRHMSVHKLHCRVEAIGVARVVVELEHRPRLRRRQPVPCEGINMSGGWLGAAILVSCLVFYRAASVSRAMISFCTSVAPS